MTIIVETRALRKKYMTAAGACLALRGIDLRIEAGEFVIVMGPSGSGKSTLMNILGCLDRQTDGTYALNGRVVTALKDSELARERNRNIGFVFQSFNLMPRLTNLANVALPLLYAGVGRSEREHRAYEVLERFGLARHAQLRPSQISGGQQQRVAIARALVNKPKIIFADEPTGNLDSHTSAEVLDLFEMLNNQGGTSIVLVTHDPVVSQRGRRLVRVVDGLIEYDGGVSCFLQ